METKWLNTLMGNVSGVDAVLLSMVFFIVYLTIKEKKNNVETVLKAIETIKWLAFGAMGVRVILAIIELIKHWR